MNLTYRQTIVEGSMRHGFGTSRYKDFMRGWLAKQAASKPTKKNDHGAGRRTSAAVKERPTMDRIKVNGILVRALATGIFRSYHV